MTLFCLVVLATVLPDVDGNLQVSGGNLTYNGQRIFLSGANIAWNCYGCDFGDLAYAQTSEALHYWIYHIGDAGANVVRKYSIFIKTLHLSVLSFIKSSISSHLRNKSYSHQVTMYLNGKICTSKS